MPPARSKGRNVPAIKASGGDDGVVDRVSNTVRQSLQHWHSKGSGFAKKVLSSTGKAAWVAGTSFLVLVVPLIIELDREAQLAELEGHQATLLGAPSQPPPLFG